LLFQFRLAMDLGKTVAELRASLTIWELILWAEFYDRERQAIKAAQER